jgi:hypothetical protein
MGATAVSNVIFAPKRLASAQQGGTAASLRKIDWKQYVFDR